MSENPISTPSLDELRRHKSMFDNTWNLTIVLATALAVISWYFGLSQLDVGPVIWVLAALAFVQFAITSQSSGVDSRPHLQLLALTSQVLGTIAMGVAWHLFGGMQQPLFPLFVVLPLMTGSLLFGFWQQGVACAIVIAVLFSGVLLSPDTNSFIEDRFGIGAAALNALPGWIPRSRMAFADVTTSPSYNLLLAFTVAAVAIALSTTSRAVADLCARNSERVRSMESEIARLQELAKQMVTHAPSAEALVLSNTGRIVNASDRFLRDFDLPEAAGQFLLDAVKFTYPDVIKRLIRSGGEEIQGATLRGREVVLRVRAEVIGSGAWQVATINMERCDDISWRGEVDALDEPVFAVNASGNVVFMNRSALAVFGENAEGGAAIGLFESEAGRWWDIAPLESARRTLERTDRRYLASIRRRKIADSIGEVYFVHLHEIGSVHAVAAL